MLRRLIFENWSILFTLIAFITALSIFLFIGYRALRMKRTDTSRIANIPLEDDETRVLANRDPQQNKAQSVNNQQQSNQQSVNKPQQQSAPQQQEGKQQQNKGQGG